MKDILSILASALLALAILFVYSPGKLDLYAHIAGGIALILSVSAIIRLKILNKKKSDGILAFITIAVWIPMNMFYFTTLSINIFFAIPLILVALIYYLH